MRIPPKRALARLIGRIAAPPLTWSLRATRRRAGFALLYHGIDRRQGDPRTELVPPTEQRLFARQLQHLRRYYRVVRPEEFPAAIAARRRWERFPVCITFDDDLPQHIDFAMPILRGEDLPATFFLCGTALDGPANAWWERLQRTVDSGRTPEWLARLLPQERRIGTGEEVDIRVLGEAVQSLTPDQRRAFAERLLDEAGPDPVNSGLPRGAVEALAAAGFGIGFHTRNHDLLTTLDDEDLERSMDQGREELAEAAGMQLRTIAYPHGPADARVARAARRAGFEIGFTATNRVAATPASDPFLLPRCDTVWLGTTLGEFAIGIAWTLLRDRDQGLTGA